MQRASEGSQLSQAVQAETTYRSAARSAYAASNPAEDIQVLSASLEPKALESLTRDAVAARARAWANAVSAQGSSPLSALNELLPPASWFQARLVMDRDVASMEENATGSQPYARAYASIVSQLPAIALQAQGVETLLDTLWQHSGAGNSLKDGHKPPIQRSQRWLPPKSTMDASHRYALDVFFITVKRRGAVEIGPAIKSICRGIVVSAAGDWNGGDTLASYTGGGLSPKSGNGVVVYCPDDRRYYAYFHLHDVTVSPGQVIEAGQLIGHGGNTGSNARKKGHGEHLHLEIHTGPNQALSSWELRDLIADLY